jgi:hypothetical protein
MSKHRSKRFGDDQPDTAVAVAEPVAHPTGATVEEQDVATLAYRRWLERGCPQGSPQEDWFEAERELHSQGRHS